MITIRHHRDKNPRVSSHMLLSLEYQIHVYYYLPRVYKLYIIIIKRRLLDDL